MRVICIVKLYTECARYLTEHTHMTLIVGVAGASFEFERGSKICLA